MEEMERRKNMKIQGFRYSQIRNCKHTFGVESEVLDFYDSTGRFPKTSWHWRSDLQPQFATVKLKENCFGIPKRMDPNPKSNTFGESIWKPKKKSYDDPFFSLRWSNTLFTISTISFAPLLERRFGEKKIPATFRGFFLDLFRSTKTIERHGHLDGIHFSSKASSNSKGPVGLRRFRR